MEEPTDKRQEEEPTDKRQEEEEPTDKRQEEEEQRLTTSDLVREDRQAEDRAAGEEDRALFSESDAAALRERWREVQAAFVDEPRRAVEDADSLVADLMQRLAETFANERSSLEGQWDRSGDVSTEDLRVALQRYRSFFDRLLSA